MSQAPSVDDLFTTFHNRLALEWVAGHAAGQRTIGTDADPGLRALLVGHLNPINPKSIQVIGATELAHLERLDPAELARTLVATFADTSVVLIVAGGLPVPDFLVAHAERHAVALFGSKLSDLELIDRLRFDLVDRLATRLTLHGVFIEVLGVGVLLTGASGVGKSELALDLIARGHRLIADDAPEFTRVAPDLVMGSCPEPLDDFLEVRGLGILNVRMMYGDNAVKRAKYLGLIVHLEGRPAAGINRWDEIPSTRTVLEVAIPEVPLFVDPARNLAVLVEAAVRSHLLRRHGYDAGQDLAARQQAQIARAGPAP